ncbi:hypothetical protein OTU49_014878 [Cherax quadricarinatus]|uniref:Uncharacterized protein n=2 Tax=Cherax quadricarinatus TaxID=27406 RepID=A0AAW0Y3C5_CHEQU
MSSEGESARGGGRVGAGNMMPQQYPAHFYPMVGYQGPPQPWFPAHPPSGAPTQWSWSPPMGYPAPTPPWSTQQPASTMTTSTSTAAMPSDEYTVDTLRRIYNDDDGRVEIQRVKVQRRHPDTGNLTFPATPDTMSVVPVGSFPLNERRPPPRKNRRKQDVQVMTAAPRPYPWYPYMPCVPYPYPYPYYLGGCVWPPASPPVSPTSWSGNEGSDRTSSRQDSIPATLDSQRLDSRISHPSRGSISPVSLRSPSPTGTSHLMDIHSLAPSDSVSVRGHKRESSLERTLRGPTPPPRTKSRASSDSKPSDIGKTQEWILEMHRALGTTIDGASDATDKASFTTAPSDVVVYKKIPPKRKRRKVKIDSISDKGSLADQKELDNVSDRQSVESDMAFDESSRLSSELTYAFRKLEKSVDVFKTKLSVECTPVHSSAPSPSIEIVHSSGDLTPTEGCMPVPPSDVSMLLEDSNKQEADQPDQHEALVSLDRGLLLGSVCSLPSLETAKTDSTIDISVHRVVMESPDSVLQGPPECNVSHSSSATPSMLETVFPASTSSIIVSPLPTVATTSQTTPAPGSQPENATVASQISTAPTDIASNLAVVSKVDPPPAPVTGISKSDTTAVQSSQVLSFNHPSAMAAPSTSQPLLVSASASHNATAIESTPTSAPEVTPAPAAVAPQASAPIPAAAPSEASAPANVVRGEALSEGGRDSRTSNSTFFSARPSDDPMLMDTDSTEILLHTTDATTADEDDDHTDSAAVSPAPDEGDYQWVLQQPGETPDLTSSNPARQDERRNAWRAEVSLWRARLVVSLCRGRGLDRQDWSTFHLLVHHPLSLDLKLSLLHAPRLCAANATTGAALVRVALIHLAQYGETLLQPEGSRQHGWRSIKVDPNQPWAPVKGAMEILRSLGYRERENGGVLKYPRRSPPEVSVLARLTLDMLVLAEELRLYLTGTHQYPTNISELFFAASTSMGVISDLPQRPPSSAGSFVSAHSETSLHLRPSSRASSVTDEDTETLQASVRQVKNHKKTVRRSSSSEEEVTLKVDSENKISPKTEAPEATLGIQEQPNVKILTDSPEMLKINTETQNLGSTVSLPTSPGDRLSANTNLSSLQDLQSIHLSFATQKSPRHSSSATSGSTETVITPVTTPAPVPEATTDNPEEHIYEEIDVIRAQVQALRASSVPLETPPPPLPPKKKISSGGEDDSGLSLTYPHVEWSSASMPGSLRGGSTGARRKKRRAPMPPEFMPSDWKNYQNKPLECPVQTTETQGTKNRKKTEYRKSLNPFYEDIDSVKEKVKELYNDSNTETEASSVSKDTDCNPFAQETTAVAGYVGKNPFYEDVDLLKNTEEYKELKSSHPRLPSSDMDGSVCPMGSLSELQENPVVVRPKRRAPKPPLTPQPDTHSSTLETSSLSPHQQLKKSEPPKRPPTPNILKQSTASSTATLPINETLNKVEEKVPANKNIHMTNEKVVSLIPDDAVMKEKPHISLEATDNSATVPSTLDDKEVTAPKKDEMFVVLSASETDKQGSTNPQNSASECAKPPTERSDSGAENRPEQEVKKSPETNSNDVIKKDSFEPQVSQDDHQTNKTEGRQTTPKVTRVTLHRISLQHPKIPPPPPPPKLPVDELDGSPPPVLPPKVSLSLLDDIPYMDANEVKYAKAKLTKQTTPQSPQYEIPEAPEKSEIAAGAPLSPATMRQSLLLRGICNVPFIDDSDLPPDCPPPPPPGPPPESPPETPHTSPPETPRTSSPITPHHSLQSLPRASSSENIMQSVQGAYINKTGISEEDTENKAPPIPPKTSQITSLESIKASEASLTEELTTTELPVSPQPVATQPQASISVETSMSQPSLPPKTTLQTGMLTPPETSTPGTHEPASGKHSLQSSISEERYEIPDTSLAPPTRPPPPKQIPSTDQTTGKAPKLYTTPSEADRYEVPEAPKVETPKTTVVEERYEIPEVVKETALLGGLNGTRFVLAKPSCILL